MLNKLSRTVGKPIYSKANTNKSVTFRYFDETDTYIGEIHA